MLAALMYVSIAVFAQTTDISEGDVTPHSELYVHDKSHSIKSRFLHLLMGPIEAPLRGVLGDDEFQSAPAAVPRSFSKKYQIETERFEGRDLWTIGPKNSDSDQVIFYIHGGAYIFNILGLHWSFIADMIDSTGATVVIPDYPLAPSATATTTHSYLEKLYRETLETYRGRDIVFMGDSSGGGLSIAFAQHLRDEGIPQPSQIIVLSPWLDVTMRNPDIVAEDDPVMRADDLRAAGVLYAGDLATDAPRVSPIYGDFEGVATIACFIGTHDLFIADARKLQSDLEAQGIPFHYYEYPKMLHTWALMRMPETKVARAQMVDLLSQQPNSTQTD